MAPQASQDSFIDEEDDTCPLCVEEFDLSDKNFRPCPCGYQVCQFCFNNIKNNMNGLCPACRRPYDEKTIEWKVVTPEEIAQFKAKVQKDAKKKAEQRQKEAQKREVETLNRKHLSGLRVIQKNLVYVVGLSPTTREDEILQTLRGDKYFGQYGKIIKIVVSKAKSSESGGSLGVYVTFARKEDAARCIAAVNGSQNGDRILRAQLGTTKYCSAYLRNETCTNKQCMFLHEPGDNDDSYSRQDLSSINSVNTQRPLPAMASSSRQPSQTQAPIQQSQPVAAAAQPMARDGSKDGSDSGDGSALPSSASWAKQRSRRGSLATSGATPSPAISQAVPATTESTDEQDATAEPQEPESAVTPATEPTTAPKRERDPVLMDLLRSINSDALSILPFESGSEELDLNSYPPLFDNHGGEKRRAIREQQEETRLHVEHESQADLRSATGPAEDDEPESGLSGSLQLGGEPEDGRDGNAAGFQRRPSTQLPIQRSSNSGSFTPAGASQNFSSQGLSNLSSINGRTLTPQQQQQLMVLKGQPQAGFLDQYPPGIGSSHSQTSALFQQQGHNRQSSRFDFANGSSAATSVKPSGNPKFLAQQSSMMPSGTHAQAGQFYGASMQGPPPGLKSTGTPPNFGQGHPFGGGSVFGAGKDSSNEMLNMLRARGATGGSQVHDSKREYMFPSFLQQYPSASSTPAPASGPQASLYGPQTGAFHDFGQKQKKKGKKHRHANTSSSGGGGLVDLADPSILQARMQHQQQSNAGVGQGLFGGQAEDEQDLPSLYEASMSVDALVADNLEFASRSSTPSVPPGFSGLPHGHPPAGDLGEDTSPQQQSRIDPASTTFAPAHISTHAPRVATPLSNVFVPSTPTQVPASTQGYGKPKQDVKSSGTAPVIAKNTPSQSPGIPVSSPALQLDDFPALESSKTRAASQASPAKGVSPAKVPASTVTGKRMPSSAYGTAAVPAAAIKGVEKRPPPGLLNISVPGKTLSGATEGIKPTISSSAFPPLSASTPSTAPLQSPVARASSAKILRVASAPRTETTPAVATPSSATSTQAPQFPPSRQSSLVSMSKQDRPATPTSELTDNASTASAPLSRANTPPPTKIGSAPLRTTTKSMQKKQRAQKAKEREISTAPPPPAEPEPEPEIAPIQGRKKKQKKEKAAGGNATASTPVASRPPSPRPVAKATSQETEMPAEPSQKTPPTAKQLTPTEPDLESKVQDSKGKTKAKSQYPPMPELITGPEDAAPDEPVNKGPPTPASTLRNLIAEGSIPDPSSLNFLKPVHSNSRYQEPQADLENGVPKLTILPNDRAALLSGRPVHKNTDGANRIMLTPNGECLRNLTAEEEKRYLDLQARIARESGPAAFFSPRHHAASGFTLVGGRAVPNGPPTFFPQSNNSTPLDPVSKIQRDEALSYINQYVLPSLSTNSQLENALNAKANAMDSELTQPGEVSAWSRWSGHPMPRPSNSDDAYGADGAHGDEGIHTTGLDGITAQLAVGRDIDVDRAQPLSNVTLLSLQDAEAAMQAARKETEGLEKRLNALIKKNKKLLLGSGN